MKLQGISEQGMKRIAKKVKGQANAGVAEGDRIIDGITFRWDDESNPDDPGWVWLDTYSDPQAVPGNEGRDPQATDEELFTAAFGRAPEGIVARKQAQVDAKQFWNSLSDDEKWTLGDELVNDYFEWENWMDEEPDNAFLNTLDKLRMNWEDMQ